jgi:hypothetical protein
MSKRKGKLSKLNDVFLSLGMEPVDTSVRGLEDIQIQAELDGAMVKDERREFPTCRGKHSYPSPSIAEKIKRRRRRGGSLPLRVYRCEVCNLWHLTSKKITQYTIKTP